MMKWKYFVLQKVYNTFQLYQAMYQFIMFKFLKRHTVYLGKVKKFFQMKLLKAKIYEIWVTCKTSKKPVLLGFLTHGDSLFQDV